MPNIIACRLASYGDYQDRAWSHLPQIGIRNIEMPAPAPDELAAAKKKLADHGLTATSLQGKTDVTQANAAESMQPQFEACAALGSKVLFLSAKAGQTDRPLVWQRLRAIGDLARSFGVTVGVETHPDLVTNGDVGLETMKAVNHPNIRINFDTANIYFYNRNRTAVGELAKVIDYVISVHLKDTPGGFEEWTFPALGTGAVDFPAIFKMLGTRGFTGPYTMELEGTKGVDRSESEQLAYIADSVAYLKRIRALT
jgi:L-ribulose-5-phosphate 3-epimerase